MLSQALRGPSSAASSAFHFSSGGLASHQSSSWEQTPSSDVLGADAPGTPREGDIVTDFTCHDADDGLEPHWAEESAAQDSGSRGDGDGGAAASLTELCRALAAAADSHRAGGLPAGTAQQPSGFPHNLARSCPKPITSARGRARGRMLHDELPVFVPPHEMASYVDPANVAESLCRKGSAAIKLRAGVLRRTGFLEGNTEVLRPTAPGAAGGSGGGAPKH